MPHVKGADGLTLKQRRFVEEYAETENGTQSALVSYDTTDPNTAHVIACENLQKPTVLSALERKRADLRAKAAEILDYGAVVCEMHEDHAEARKDRAWGACAKYTDLKGKALGLWDKEADNAGVTVEFTINLGSDGG